MARRKTRKITFIYHGQKLIDEQVISMLPRQQYEYKTIEFINLANTEISIELLKEVASKLSDWQRTLLDSRYLDHSIRDPEHEFLLLEDAVKLLFLKNNSWLIGTPLVIDNNNVYRFQQASDAVEWLNAKDFKMLNTLKDQLIEVPSTLS